MYFPVPTFRFTPNLIYILLEIPLTGTRHAQLPARVLGPIQSPNRLPQILRIYQHHERRAGPRLEMHLLRPRSHLAEEPVCGVEGFILWG